LGLSVGTLVSVCLKLSWLGFVRYEGGWDKELLVRIFEFKG